MSLIEHFKSATFNQKSGEITFTERKLMKSAFRSTTNTPGGSKKKTTVNPEVNEKEISQRDTENDQSEVEVSQQEQEISLQVQSNNEKSDLQDYVLNSPKKTEKTIPQKPKTPTLIKRNKDY